MASRRSHAALDSKLIESELRVPRSGTYIMKPTASCEAALLWVNMIPREGERMLIPQLRSFGACSGFLMDTCPLGTRLQANRRSCVH